MDLAESLSHSKWECKYHVVFIPKGRRKVLYEKLRAAVLSWQVRERKRSYGFLRKIRPTE